MEAPHSISASN